MRQPIRFRRIKVRITRAGWLYIGVTLFVGAAAVNTTNNLLYLVTSGLLALMALSGMVAYRALRHLELDLDLPGEWFAGRETAVAVGVTNRRRRLPTYLLRLARGTRDTLLLEVPPGDRAVSDLSFTFPHRGRHPLGEVLVTSSFPFAFFHRGGTVTLDGDVVVYPRPEPVPRHAWAGLGGTETGTGVSRRGVGGDFRGIRPYLPGDTLARIDWKAWGRLGELRVKEFDEEGAPPLLLDLQSVPGPGLERRLSQLTGLILEAGSRGQAVGLRLPGETIGPALGAEVRERQLRALALYSGTSLPSTPGIAARPQGPGDGA